LPLEITPALIEEVRAELPELPDARRQRFVEAHGLPDYDAGVLTSSRDMADYFEAVAGGCDDPKLAANWVMGELAGALNRDGTDIADSPLDAESLAGLLRRVLDGTLSGKMAKEVFEAMWNGEGDADAIIAERGLEQVTDAGEIEALVDEVIASNPEQLEQYRAGKTKLMGFFVGQVMKASGGKANPQQVNEILRSRLDG